MASPAQPTTVVPMCPRRRPQRGRRDALAAAHRHLARCKLAASTVKAYKRQASAYVTWLDEHAADHPDAFADLVGAEAAVTAWAATSCAPRPRPPLSTRPWPPSPSCTPTPECTSRSNAPASPGPASPTRSPKPSRAPSNAPLPAAAPATPPSSRSCWTPGPARKSAPGWTSRTSRSPPAPAPSACTARANEVRTTPLPAPARDRITAWLDERGRHPGPLWTGQRGPLTTSGIVQVVLAAGAVPPGLRPHRCRHTYATRLRQGGADVAQVQALLGHASRHRRPLLPRRNRRNHRGRRAGLRPLTTPPASGRQAASSLGGPA